ncbi:hypothetical protein PHLGIDRAFT_262280 [Phlebiopsis gigantea 11061_1 CR5-6]|uniref:Uncharacterized protein n=1 Tax=Phlebiopsis gigantea (strain 11061_1 CR5-6) TaxID=745531 RepID=A0A0C3SEA8_PHLG1|nr:hypothetical protein PHLGIDRAFT_262280 [Phlebiopsis gigantea 11061_1 CR5-6]
MAPSLYTASAAGAALQILPLFAHNSSGSHNSTRNVVIVDLHTTVVIPDFHLYYGDQSIQSFQPPYHALGDGSLVATPFIVDVRGANLLLVIFSALAMFFILNTITAIQFLRRWTVKRMSLFYVLFVSQLLGAVGMLAPLVTYFDQFASCNVTSFVLLISSGASISLLMTGILGYKAYRCLNNSRIVLVVLALLRSTMIALLIVCLTRLDVSRRISGSCFPVNNTHMMSLIVIVQAVESAFICGCFLYAARKTSRSATYQGRLSIRTSSDTRRGRKAEDSGGTSRSDADQGRRGWWDYVPEASQSDLNLLSTTPKLSSDTRKSIRLPGFSHPSSSRPSQSVYRKSSIREEHPIPRPPQRAPSVTFSRVRSPQVRASPEDPQTHHRRLSSASSMMSRISKYIPRMQLFKEVLRNELMYTAFLTVIYLLMAILMLICSPRKVLLPSVGWLLCDWLLLSIFTMHSFRRVLRRHERDAILQHPAAWDPLYRAELEVARILNKRRVYSPVSTIAPDFTIQSRPPSDPFEDFILSTSSASLRSAPNSDTSSELSQFSSSHHPPRSRSSVFTNSISSEPLSYEEPLGPRTHDIDLNVLPVYIHGEWASTPPMPSPKSMDYPYSRLSLPISELSSSSFTRRAAHGE